VSWTDQDGSRRSVRTAEPTRTVTELAATFVGEVPGLSVTRPSLEDVYLEMVGLQ
jgi:ABC-2 type transport system ATP-binding protein